ncbi:MAG: adenylate cyclase, partial [Betaproteobacteria bacterium]
EIAAEFGAPETRFSGEGIQFYFGYPTAHEHDAERAVRAGIRIVGAPAALAPGIAANLQARIGIASGVVIVGDLSGRGAGADMVGEASSLASRLCSMAPPNEIWISSQTRELVGDLFLYRSVAPDIPHGDAPTIAWQVCGESRVGRAGELELILRRWRQSETAHGSTVLISGEPGIGKSRLVKAFAQRIESEPHEKLYYQCSPYHQNTPLYPLITQIERAAGFEREDSVERRLDKLEKMISAAGIEPTNAAPLLALLLSLPASQRYPPVALSPAQRRRRTLAVLVDLVSGLAMRQPLLLIFEDAHWADATSLEWLDLVTDMAHRLSIVILITHRPDFKPAWFARPNVTTLVIGRLEPHDVRTIIRGISSGHELSASVIDRIVHQTDGIPLYVEELTKMVIESDLLLRDEIGSDTPTAFAIPPTLQDSLSARVDRLGTSREVAQIGAAIGREFSYELLRGLITLDQPALESALNALEKSELLFRHGEIPEATYSFAHALVQEAAYEAMPKSRRRALHQRIAELLTASTTSPAEVEPEVVAQHYALAGDDEAAAQWWGRSGDRAIGRSAYVEAASNFGKALVLAERIAPSPPQHRLLLRLQIGYGHALIASRGHGAPETTAAFAQARALAAEIEDGSERLSAIYGMWSGSFCRAELGPMQELAERFAQNVESSPELSEAGVVAERLLGVTAWFRGDYLRARTHLERSIAIYDNEQHGPLALRFGQDVGVCAMVYLALVLWTLGDSREARRWMETAHALAMQMNHVPTIAYMRMHECALACIAGDPQAVLPPAQAVVEMSRQHGGDGSLSRARGNLHAELRLSPGGGRSGHRKHRNRAHACHRSTCGDRAIGAAMA